MNLDEFIATGRANDYLEHIDLIRNEFDQLGCERFLWKSYREECDAEAWTKTALSKVTSYSPTPEVNSFIKQLAIIGDDEVGFIFQESECERFAIANVVAEHAKKSLAVQNIFEDDCTKNILAVFEKSQIEYIGMMHCLLYKTDYLGGETYGGYKLYGRTLLSYAEFLEHDGLALTEVSEKGVGKKFAHFCGDRFRRDTDPFAIIECRKKICKLIERGLFASELDMYLNLYWSVLPPLQEMYLASKQVYDENSAAYQSLATELYSEIIHTGTISSKWKAERELFSIVKKLHPDALFQYKPSWLSPQRLDIFIPSLSVGIEYQGPQHYRETPLFGGAEGYIKLSKLDNQKRVKCRENGVYLLEWPYSFSVTRRNVQRKISEFLRENGLDGQMSLLDLLI